MTQVNILLYMYNINKGSNTSSDNLRGSHLTLTNNTHKLHSDI